jgi:hypothetical protein
MGLAVLVGRNIDDRTVTMVLKDEMCMIVVVGEVGCVLNANGTEADIRSQPQIIRRRAIPRALYAARLQALTSRLRRLRIQQSQVVSMGHM